MKPSNKYEFSIEHWDAENIVFAFREIGTEEWEFVEFETKRFEWWANERGFFDYEDEEGVKRRDNSFEQYLDRNLRCVVNLELFQYHLSLKQIQSV